MKSYQITAPMDAGKFEIRIFEKQESLVRLMNEKICIAFHQILFSDLDYV